MRLFDLFRSKPPKAMRQTVCEICHEPVLTDSAGKVAHLVCEIRRKTETGIAEKRQQEERRQIEIVKTAMRELRKEDAAGKPERVRGLLDRLEGIQQQSSGTRKWPHAAQLIDLLPEIIAELKYVANPES